MVGEPLLQDGDLPCWALMISSANWRSVGSLPFASSTSAMAIAPSWCGIIARAKSTSGSPLYSIAIASCIVALAAA